MNCNMYILYAIQCISPAIFLCIYLQLYQFKINKKTTTNYNYMITAGRVVTILQDKFARCMAAEWLVYISASASTSELARLAR